MVNSLKININLFKYPSKHMLMDKYKYINYNKNDI